MNINIRLLSIRKHKTVSFLNSYSKEFGVTQFMIPNDIFDLIKCGDLLNISFSETLNNRGNLVKKIEKINYVIPCYDFESYKGINSNINDTKYLDYINARNGGSQILLFKYKKYILEEMKKYLNELNFLDVTMLLNSTEYYKNGSKINDAVIENRTDSEPKYLRVTLENQLKQISSIMLESVYSIDKVFRNMGEDKTHINEFLMLEFVSLSLSMENILNYIKKVDELSKKAAIDYNIPMQEINDLEILDYNDIIKINSNYNEIRKKFKNTLVVNFPCDSPFIKEKDGLKTETRWYMQGHWISHFYEDENDYEKIKYNLNKQSIANNKSDTNWMNNFEWGMPNTTSLGLSVDRWLQMLLGKEDINSVANPLQLNYKKRRK